MFNEYPCLSDLLGGLCKDGKKGGTWRMYMIYDAVAARNYLLCNLLDGLEGSGFGSWRGSTQGMR